MGWDSNPRWARAHAGFQDRCLNPLGHPSKLLIQWVFYLNLERAEKGVATEIATERPQRPSPPPIFAPRNAASILAAASSCIVSETWLYRSSVTAIVECPRRSCATFGCTPASKR